MCHKTREWTSPVKLMLESIFTILPTELPGILDPPISPNPSINNPTAGSITLKWSPPFLWPGVPVDYYVVYITNKRGKSTYHPVNTTFNDATISFITIADDHEMIEACENLYFGISAISDDQEKLPSFTASGGYIPCK